MTPRLALAAILLTAPLGLAQHSGLPPQNPIGPAKKTPPAQPTTPAPAPNAEDPLSGPAVVDNPKTTIVEHDASGRLIRPEVGPEEAAYAKLDLTPEQRGPIDALLAKRAATFDQIVRANVDLLVQLQSARQANDADAYRKSFTELQKAFRPINVAGPLRAQIAKELPKDQAGEFEAMQRQYWRAVYDEAVKTEGAPAPTPDNHAKPEAGHNMADIIRREIVTNFGQEIDRSFKRITEQLHERLESFLSQLDLTSEQDAKIRAMVTDYAQKTKLNPTPEDRAELFRRILPELTPEQRKKLIAMSEPRAPARDESPAATPPPAPQP